MNKPNIIFYFYRSKTISQPTHSIRLFTTNFVGTGFCWRFNRRFIGSFNSHIGQQNTFGHSSLSHFCFRTYFIVFCLNKYIERQRIFGRLCCGVNFGKHQNSGLRPNIKVSTNNDMALPNCHVHLIGFICYNR